MAQSTLIIYDSIETVGDDERSYWESYIDFYELYWGGPMSPFGIWFGNEYDNFRRAIAEHLSIDGAGVRDCFFIRSEGGLYICPLAGSAGGNGNILWCDNAVPFEWFAAFNESGRRDFHSHWGFSSIYYDTKVSEAAMRVAAATEILSLAFEKTDHEDLRAMVEWMGKGIGDMDKWFSRRDGNGYAVLNYGDICSVIKPQSLGRERSVEQVAEIFSLLDGGRWEQSHDLAARLLRRWEDLRQMCAATGGGETFQ